MILVGVYSVCVSVFHVLSTYFLNHKDHNTREGIHGKIMGTNDYGWWSQYLSGGPKIYRVAERYFFVLLPLPKCRVVTLLVFNGIINISHYLYKY